MAPEEFRFAFELAEGVLTLLNLGSHEVAAPENEGRILLGVDTGLLKAAAAAEFGIVGLPTEVGCVEVELPR